MSNRPADKSRAFETSLPQATFRLMLFVFAVVLALLAIPGAREVINGPYSGIHTQNLVIQHVRPDGPNGDSPLAPGDEIQAIDGVTLRNHSHYLSLLAANTAFAPQDYRILRDGRTFDVTVRYIAMPRALKYRRFGFLFVAFLSLVVGLWVHTRRPDTLGTLFAANCVVLAFFLTDLPSPKTPQLQLASEMVQDFVIMAFPALLLHFFLVFPPRKHRGMHLSLRRLTYLYAPPTLIFAYACYLAVTRFVSGREIAGPVDTLLLLSTIYLIVYMLFSFGVFMRSYHRSPIAQKLKLRVVIAGTLAGLLPLLATTVLRNFIPGESRPLEWASAACLAFLPLSFAYAILKHGAIELNIVVRKSIVYTFLTGAIVAGYYVLVVVAGGVLVNELGVSERAWTPLAILLLAVVFAPVRERIQRVVDRMFYRGEYVYKQEMVALSRQLARCADRDQIVDQLCDRLASLLGPSFLAVYSHANGGQLSLTHVQAEAPELPPSFDTEGFLGRYLSRYHRPLMVEYLDQAWARPNIDAASRRLLRTDGVAVCVPMLASDAFVGLVVLGEKRSGVAYRRADADLLESAGEQVALALQNADLLESSLEQERLKGEVMLARDIQLSLLPSAPPQAPNMNILGQMTSSNEVGGDYFDYFPIDEHRVGVAIGDVSGKGVPAAMLMSSLRAVFRNLALKGKLGPADVNSELNSFVADNAKPGQFTTFFYGVLDLRTWTFSYSNAGHCPALLVKDDYVDRLGEGGMMLGVQNPHRYVDGRVRIDAGDCLFLYTDGVTEQKNETGDEYGDDRLIAFLRRTRNLPVEDVQTQLLEDVIAFGNGRQDDDITSVILCHKAS